MSDEPRITPPPSDPALVPEAGRSTLPIGLVVLTLLLLFLGGLYFDKHGAWFDHQVYAPYASADELELYQPKSGAAAALARGKVVYDQVCGICHGPDGMGKPNLAPPLAGSEWVNPAGVNRFIHIPLTGLNGHLTVKGQDWNLSMAAMGAVLSDEDLAAALTYVRGSWGNKGSAVTADDVHKVRAALGAHPLPMTGDQMKAMPE
jgi:mono/diheme cytochrome c family protein